MPRIASDDRKFTRDFSLIAERARAMSETNDCAVKAIALATGADYEVVHKLCAKHGRKRRKGTYWTTIRKVVDELGFEMKLWRYDYVPEGWGGEEFMVERRSLTALIRSYPGRHGQVLKSITTHHPARFPNQWRFAIGRSFIAEVTGGRHVAAIINGETHDWTKGRAMRVHAMWEVVPKD